MVSAVAIVGAAVISSESAKSSSKRAAKSAREAGERILTAGERAREDVLENIPLAQQQLQAGASGAIDIFQQAIPEQQRQITAGSLAAQRTTGLGFNQAQQALLGSQLSPFDQALLGQQVSPFSVEEVPFSRRPFSNAQGLLSSISRPLDEPPEVNPDLRTQSRLGLPGNVQVGIDRTERRLQGRFER